MDFGRQPRYPGVPDGSQIEGWVEHIDRRGDHPAVRVMLADGTFTTAAIAADQLEWQEVLVGQIVPLRLSQLSG